jgi:hypothetical protein
MKIPKTKAEWIKWQVDVVGADPSYALALVEERIKEQRDKAQTEISDEEAIRLYYKEEDAEIREGNAWAKKAGWDKWFSDKDEDESEEAEEEEL